MGDSNTSLSFEKSAEKTATNIRGKSSRKLEFFTNETSNSFIESCDLSSV